MQGGKITATSIHSKKHLQVSTNLPNLRRIKTDENAELVIEKSSKVLGLRKIENSGKTVIEAEISMLTEIQNAKKASLKIETPTSLPGIRTLANIQGRLEIGSKLPNLREIVVMNDAEIIALPGADFSSTTKLTVKEKGIFYVAKGANVSGITLLHNYGNTTLHTKLTKVASIYNGKTATLSLYGKVTVKNPDKRALVQNDGKILVKHEDQDKEEKDYKDLEIWGDYKASSDAVMQIEGSVFANDFQNEGIFYSPNSLVVTQPKTITKWGKIVTKNSIDYDLKGTPLNLSGDFITTVITGEKKEFKIHSEQEVQIETPVNMNVDLEIETPAIDISSELYVKDLKIKTRKFTLTGIVKVDENVFIEAEDFENTSGKLHALGDITFNLTGIFTNGGGKLEGTRTLNYTYYVKTPVSCSQTFTGSTWGHKRSKTEHSYPIVDLLGRLAYMVAKEQQGTAVVKSYTLSFETAGQVCCCGKLTVNSSVIKNDFGCLHSKLGMYLSGREDVSNIIGLVYSLGETIINGSNFLNGIFFEDPVYVHDAVDPNKPSIREMKIKTGVWVERRTHSCHSPNYWTHWKYGKKPIVVDFSPKSPISLPESKYPGYIFSEKDVKINADFRADLGKIVSAQNIFIQGVIQQNTANLVARGDIHMAFKEMELEQMRIRAENVVIEGLKNLTIGGYIMPFVASDGKIGVSFDLEKISVYLNFMLLNKKNFKDSGKSLCVTPGLAPSSLIPYAEEEIRTIRSFSDTAWAGDMLRKEYFVPTISDQVMGKLLRLVITPIYGFDREYLNISVIGQLERAGRKMIESFKYTKDCPIPQGTLAIIYGESDKPDQEIEIDGELKLIPQLRPYLLIGDIIEGTVKYIEAKQSTFIKSADATIKPGEIGIDTQSLFIEVDDKLKLIAESVYDEYAKKTEISRVELKVPDVLKLSAKGEIENQAAKLEGKEVILQSKDIREKAEHFDPIRKRVRGGVITQTSVVRPQIIGENSLEIIAPTGEYTQIGDIKAGEGGIKIKAEKHTAAPTFVATTVDLKKGKTTEHLEMQTPETTKFESTGPVVFCSKDMTLIGAEIIAPSVIFSGEKLDYYLPLEEL
jgi:hypothetical protein